MALTAGVDIGSTASKAVIMIDGRCVSRIVGPSSTNPKRTALDIYQQALDAAGAVETDVDYVVGTGYGRTQVEFAHRNISEITCHGRGAHFLRPSSRTVIDIGGQDTKVVSVDDRGDLMDFAMNDKCAAGTGRFLEAMSRSMDVPVEGMADYYFGVGEPCTITSMCSVFAESEVINLLNDGVPLTPIVKGLLLSMAGRVAALARRIGLAPDIVVTGGVAKNRGLVRAVEEKLKVRAADLGGEDPQIVGALGAAVIAAEFANGRSVGL